MSKDKSLQAGKRDALAKIHGRTNLIDRVRLVEVSPR